jgi:hypothetical protein
MRTPLDDLAQPADERLRREVLPPDWSSRGRQPEASSIRNSARLAWYLAAARLPSDPSMTARPSVVHRDHLQPRPRFLSRISNSGS